MSIFGPLEFRPGLQFASPGMRVSQPMGAAAWTPASPTTSGGVSPHTWHYAGSGALYQDAAKITPATNDGDPIGASVNQGSDIHDITQGTAANKPTLKLNIWNGEPIYRFDGTNDYLQSLFGGGAISQPYTVFAVAQLDAAAVNDNTNRCIVDGINSGHRAVIYQRNPPMPDAWCIRNITIIDGGASDSNVNVWTAVFNGASSDFWLNGVLEGSGDCGGDDWDGLTLGNAYNFSAPWDGDIAEVIIYNSVLNTADKNEVGNYLADKYGLGYTDIV